MAVARMGLPLFLKLLNFFPVRPSDPDKTSKKVRDMFVEAGRRKESGDILAAYSNRREKRLFGKPVLFQQSALRHGAKIGDQASIAPHRKGAAAGDIPGPRALPIERRKMRPHGEDAPLSCRRAR